MGAYRYYNNVEWEKKNDISSLKARYKRCPIRIESGYNFGEGISDERIRRPRRGG